MAVDPGNADHILIGAGSGGVWETKDGGRNWSPRTDDQPSLSIGAIAFDPGNPLVVYAGTGKGDSVSALGVCVLRSTDGGAVWTSFNNGLPNALVKDLVFHGCSRLLRAATQSRGVWEIAVDQATMPSVEIYLRDSAVDSGRSSPSPSGVPDPFNLGPQTFWWQCQDIKVDAPSFQRPNIADVDFEFFEDEHGILAASLKHENPQRNQTARIHV